MGAQWGDNACAYHFFLFAQSQNGKEIDKVIDVSKSRDGIDY